ncbi:MAG: CoA pyrophosphatase [Deltaproteobacteria bacterium]|jgi:8-oxo-dGTP pyrophosphatase MutT (NUDIX family)|nr:CoA pyrophosphatase [Deltaproteobacteria bacterium]
MIDRNWLIQRLENFPQRTISRAGLRPAAVLLPLFADTCQDHVLFTVRTNHLHHHAGEISFPGGRQSHGDANPCDTAIRETVEELGIPEKHIEILGRLDDYYSVHGYHVVPFVGLIPRPENLKPDDFEIAQVFDAPLNHFRNPEVHSVEDWSHQGRTAPVDFYHFAGHTIWGLTAAILKQFLMETVDAPDSKLESVKEAGLHR